MAPTFSTNTNMTNTTTTPDKAIATKEIVALAETHGHITPELVLEAATAPTSPLHRFFDWNDGAAANKYRLLQAATMIRRIKVTITGGDEQNVRVRAFVNVREEITTEEESEDQPIKGIYVPLQVAIEIPCYKTQMIEQCKREIDAFKNKYKGLKEAASIIEAMDGFTVQH
jgi:hypothetical protein